MEFHSADEGFSTLVGELHRSRLGRPLAGIWDVIEGEGEGGDLVEFVESFPLCDLFQA